MLQRINDASVSRVETVNAFMRGVYLWMTIGLGVTAACSYFALTSQAVIRTMITSPMLFLGLLIGEMVLAIWLLRSVHTMSSGKATGIFLAYTALSGVTLAPILLMYTSASVFQAFLTTAGMFGAMTLYGLFTKRDLTGLGSFLLMGLFGIVIAMIVNMFIQSSRMTMVISMLGVVIFAGLTAWDTQKLRVMGESAPMDDATALRRGTILGALTLYLDFINLFLMLLRLIGDRR